MNVFYIILISYIYFITVIVIMVYINFFSSDFFIFHPPLVLFNNIYSTYSSYIIIHLLLFVNQLVVNILSNTVYSWIINTVQDTTKQVSYSISKTIFIINSFVLMSEISSMVLMVCYTTRFSMVLVMLIANILSSTIINYKYMVNKREDFESEKYKDITDSYNNV